MPGTPSGSRHCAMQVDKFRAILKLQGGSAIFKIGNGENAEWANAETGLQLH